MAEAKIRFSNITDILRYGCTYYVDPLNKDLVGYPFVTLAPEHRELIKYWYLHFEAGHLYPVVDGIHESTPKDAVALYADFDTNFYMYAYLTMGGVSLTSIPMRQDTGRNLCVLWTPQGYGDKAPLYVQDRIFDAKFLEANDIAPLALGFARFPDIATGVGIDS